MRVKKKATASTTTKTMTMMIDPKQTKLDLVYQTSLVQSIQPNLSFLHIDGNGSHRPGQLNQSRLGARWFFDITSPRHTDLDGIATAFGLSCGQGSSILDDFFVDILIRKPNDHVGSWTSRTVRARNGEIANYIMHNETTPI